MAEGFSPSVRFPQTTVECESCDAEFDVRWFCKNCPASLCDTCKEKHSKDKLMKKHEVVPRSESVLWSHGSWKVSEPCKKHKSRDLVTFCNDCEEPCCVNCIEEHPRHSFVTIEKKYVEAETRLNTLANDLIKVSLPEIERDISLIKQKIDSCNKDFDFAKSEVDKFLVRMQHALDQSCTELKSELTKKQNQFCLELNSYLSESENTMKDIESTISSVEKRIKSGGLDLIKYFPENPQIPSHFDLTTAKPHFVPDDTVLIQVRKHIGKIVFDQHKQKSGEKVSADDIELEKTSSFDIALRGRCVIPVDGDKAWVSCNDRENIYLYDIGGKLIKSVKIQNSTGIHDMAVQTNGNVIASCQDKKIRCITMDGKITTLLETAPFSCQGVCLTDKEKIVVCMIGKEKENHIAIYSNDGRSKEMKLSATDENNQPLLTFPYRVLTKDKQVVALNLRKNIVSVDQESDKVLWIYDGEQAKPDKQFCPAAICLYKCSLFLVPDDNNDSLHFIDKEGTLIKAIMTKNMGIGDPWGIGVDNQNWRIWCGSLHSEKLWILNYKK